MPCSGHSHQDLWGDRHPITVMASVAEEMALRRDIAFTRTLGNFTQELERELISLNGKSVDEAIARIMALQSVNPTKNPEVAARQAQKVVERVLGVEMASQAAPAVSKATKLAYELTRFGDVLKPADWNLTDRRAIQWLQSDGMYWVGKMPTNYTLGPGRLPLGQFIGRTVADGLREGMSSDEIGALLGSKSGLMRPDHYWRGVASNAMTRASSMGHAESFVANGISTYEWVSVRDERTSEVCDELHGQVFQVSVLVQVRDRMMAAASPEDVKAIWPWVTTDRVIEAKQQPSPADALAKLGVAAPPIHFHCRSVVVARDSGPVTNVTTPPPPAIRAPKVSPPPLKPNGRPQPSKANPLWPVMNPSNFMRRKWDDTVRPGSQLTYGHVNAAGVGVPLEIADGPFAGRFISSFPTLDPPKGAGWTWVPDATVSQSGGSWVGKKAFKEMRESSGQSLRGIGKVESNRFRAWKKAYLKDGDSGGLPGDGDGWFSGLAGSVSASAPAAQQTAYFTQLAEAFSELANRIGFDKAIAELAKQSGGQAGAGVFRKGISAVRGGPRAAAQSAAVSTMERMGRLYSKRAVAQYGLDDGLLVRGKKHSITYSPGSRANYNPSKGQITFRNSPSANLHETGHWVEMRSARFTKNGKDTIIGRASKEFLRRRTKGKTRKLSSLTGNRAYRDWEVARVGDKPFISPYVGKVYKMDNATEVFSMGVEHMFSDRWRYLFQEDREHFGLTLAILMGRVGRSL